jgi:hypothetical protein
MKLLSILILAVGLAFGAGCSTKIESLNKEQADKLADCIISPIPNQKWVVLEDIKDNPEILNAAVLEKFKKKYQIFNSRDDIPKKFIRESDIAASYTKGFILKYRITLDSGDSVTVVSERYIAPLSIWGSEVKYKWDGKEWVITGILKMWGS